MWRVTFAKTTKEYFLHYWWLVAIVLLGGGLAFAFPHLFHSVYPLDELHRDLAVVTRMKAGVYPLIGPPASVGGIYFGPVYYYLLYLGALVTGFSLYGLLLVGWLSWCVTGVMLIYVTWRWYRDPYIVCVATGLYGFSILTFQLAQYVSNPNFVPLCALLFFYGLERCMHLSPGRRYRWILLVAISFGIGTQLHAAACIGMVVAGLVSLKWLKPALREYGIGLLLIVSMYVPYISYEYAHGFPNAHGLLTLLIGPHVYISFFDRILGYVQFWISTILSTHGFFNVLGLSNMYFFPVFVCALCAIPFLVHLNKRTLRTSHQALPVAENAQIVMGIWFFAPTMVYLLPIGALGGLQIYYYLLLMPLAFILGAYYIVLFWRRGWRLVIAYSVVFIALLAFYQQWLYHAVTR